MSKRRQVWAAILLALAGLFLGVAASGLDRVLRSDATAFDVYAFIATLIAGLLLSGASALLAAAGLLRNSALLGLVAAVAIGVCLIATIPLLRNIAPQTSTQVTVTPTGGRVYLASPLTPLANAVLRTRPRCDRPGYFNHGTQVPAGLVVVNSICDTSSALPVDLREHPGRDRDKSPVVAYAFDGAVFSDACTVSGDEATNSSGLSSRQWVRVRTESGPAFMSQLLTTSQALPACT
jgi:hypothetical protein